MQKFPRNVRKFISKVYQKYNFLHKKNREFSSQNDEIKFIWFTKDLMFLRLIVAYSMIKVLQKIINNKISGHGSKTPPYHFCKEILKIYIENDYYWETPKHLLSKIKWCSTTIEKSAYNSENRSPNWRTSNICPTIREILAYFLPPEEKYQTPKPEERLHTSSQLGISSKCPTTREKSHPCKRKWFTQIPLKPSKRNVNLHSRSRQSLEWISPTE